MGGDSELTQLDKIGNSTGGRNPIQESRYQELLKQQGGSPAASGGVVGQQQAVTAGAGAQQQNFQDLIGQERGAVTDFLSNYKSAVPGIQTAAENKWGIPQQLSGVNALNSRIQDLKYNAGNEGAGGFASSGQVQGALDTRLNPQYQTSLTNLLQSEGVAQQEEAQGLAPYQSQQALLSERLATEMSGFGANESAQLQTLLGQLQSGTQLTETQLTTANNLATAMLQKEAALAQANAQVQAAQIGQQYQKVPSGDTLFNTWLKGQNGITAP